MSKNERKCNRWVDVLRSVGLCLSCNWVGCIFRAEGRRRMSRSCSRFCNRKNCRSQKWKHFSSFQSLSFFLLLVCLNLWSCSHQSSSIKISPSLYPPISSHFLLIWLNLWPSAIFDQDHGVLPPPHINCSDSLTDWRVSTFSESQLLSPKTRENATNTSIVGLWKASKQFFSEINHSHESSFHKLRGGILSLHLAQTTMCQCQHQHRSI